MMRRWIEMNSNRSGYHSSCTNLSNDDNLLAAELLLKLLNQVLLLDHLLVESELRDGNKDDDCLLVGVNIRLLV